MEPAGSGATWPNAAAGKGGDARSKATEAAEGPISLMPGGKSFKKSVTKSSLRWSKGEWAGLDTGRGLVSNSLGRMSSRRGGW
jgi:hypothetical protein